MRALLTAAATAALVAFASPSFAQECVPVAAIGAQLKAASIPEGDVFATDDALFVNLYTKALGIGIPDGAEPVGLLLVRKGNAVLVGLVENKNGYCIQYTAVIPMHAHVKAFAAARTTGA